MGKEKRAAYRGNTAKASYIRIAPRKLRVVADIIRDMRVEEALSTLQFTEKRGAKVFQELINSALGNVMDEQVKIESNPDKEWEDDRTKLLDWDVDRLYVRTVHVDEGPTMRRYRPRAMGRATRIRKRTSHVKVVLAP